MPGPTPLILQLLQQSDLK